MAASRTIDLQTSSRFVPYDGLSVVAAECAAAATQQQGTGGSDLTCAAIPRHAGSYIEGAIPLRDLGDACDIMACAHLCAASADGGGNGGSGSGCDSGGTDGGGPGGGGCCARDGAATDGAGATAAAAVPPPGPPPPFGAAAARRHMTTLGASTRQRVCGKVFALGEMCVQRRRDAVQLSVPLFYCLCC